MAWKQYLDVGFKVFVAAVLVALAPKACASYRDSAPELLECQAALVECRGQNWDHLQSLGACHEAMQSYERVLGIETKQGAQGELAECEMRIVSCEAMLDIEQEAHR